MVDGGVRIDAVHVVAQRACHGDIGVEAALETGKTVSDAPWELSPRPAGANDAFHAAAPQLNERVLGALRYHPVRFWAEQRAVDIKECSLYHMAPSVLATPLKG